MIVEIAFEQIMNIVFQEIVETWCHTGVEMKTAVRQKGIDLTTFLFCYFSILIILMAKSGKRET